MRDQVRSTMHACLRALPGAVLELTPGGSVVDSNGRLEDALGCELRGRPIREILDGPSWEKLARLLHAEPDPGGSSRCELIVECATVVEPRTFIVVRDGGETGGIWLLEQPTDQRSERLHDELTSINAELVNAQRDLSKKSGRLSRALDEIEEKLRENEQLSGMLQYQNEEMEAQNEELLAMTEELHSGQQHLLELNQLLERRTRELQIALSARNRFYAAMSHELRTPINAVLGYNDLLLGGIYGPLPEQQELALERAQRAVHHLRELVNDVLDIAKIESGRLEVEFTSVDPRELVEDLFATLQPMADAQGTQLRITAWDGPQALLTDPRRLRQILLNLLSNAIKYGGGRPVWVQCSRAGGGELVIEVIDNGDGITQEDLSTIFEEFVQLGGASGGTGLGLPIARRLSHVLGGTLEASSTVGVGSTFRLILPIEPPEERGATAHTASRA